MNAPPIISPNLDQSSRLLVGLATVALWLLIGINALTFICSVASALIKDKGDGVMVGIVIFVLMHVAVVIALLALPAVIRCRQLAWPRFALVLGFTPLPLLFAVSHLVRIIRNLL